jgi:hypothetical protein
LLRRWDGGEAQRTLVGADCFEGAWADECTVGDKFKIAAEVKIDTITSPWRYDQVSKSRELLMDFEFRCHTCGEIHRGMPSFGADAPRSFYAVPAAERAARCDLGSDDCVIDSIKFFVRGCLEIPVHGADDPLIWIVWISLSEQSFLAWLKVFGQEHRSYMDPLFGWLDASFKPYPEMIELKTRVHFRDHGLRPTIELEPTDHPLALEQRNGIPVERVAEIYAIMMHGRDH